MTKQQEAINLLNITLFELVKTIMSKAVILSKEDLSYFEQQSDRIQDLLVTPRP
jgi:hypothetical protein